MKNLRRLLLIAVPALVLLPQSRLLAGPRETATIQEAIEVLDSLAAIPLRCIPHALLGDAQGLAIIPGVIKAGFVVGARHGRGILLARGADGSWGRPGFLTLTGAGIGWQAGIRSTDLVLVS
jgi:lipid-binding SYLF domain-containing protein